MPHKHEVVSFRMQNNLLSLMFLYLYVFMYAFSEKQIFLAFILVNLVNMISSNYDLNLHKSTHISIKISFLNKTLADSTYIVYLFSFWCSQLTTRRVIPLLVRGKIPLSSDSIDPSIGIIYSNFLILDNLELLDSFLCLFWVNIINFFATQ